MSPPCQHALRRSITWRRTPQSQGAGGAAAPYRDSFRRAAPHHASARRTPESRHGTVALAQAHERRREARVRKASAECGDHHAARSQATLSRWRAYRRPGHRESMPPICSGDETNSEPPAGKTIAREPMHRSLAGKEPWGCPRRGRARQRRANWADPGALRAIPADSRRRIHMKGLGAARSDENRRQAHERNSRRLTSLLTARSSSGHKCACITRLS